MCSQRQTADGGRRIVSVINQGLGRSRADVPQKNWRSSGASGGGGAYRRFLPPLLQPPSRRDTGLWLGRAGHSVLGAFCWCALCTGAGVSGSQEKNLRRERRSPGGSGGRRLRRFLAPSTSQLAVYSESLLFSFSPPPPPSSQFTPSRFFFLFYTHISMPNSAASSMASSP